MNDELIIKELNKLLIKAKNNNEIPIAALIIFKNKIIARSYNKTEQNHNILNHAEINVIKQASNILNNWRLNECELYVTLEPCSMCKEIIKKARIKNVYYFIKQNNEQTETNPDYYYIKNDYLSSELKDYFKNKRK